MVNEWDKEPNEMFWEYKGFQCRILRRLGMGHLCGYVKIPENHPWYGVAYSDILVECHGGLTYGKKEKDGYWIGFDCAHVYDKIPFYRSGGIYRNMEYVKKEVEKIVEQAMKETLTV